MEILKRLQNQTQDQQLETLVAIIRDGDNEQKKSVMTLLNIWGAESINCGMKLQIYPREIKTDVEDFLAQRWHSQRATHVAYCQDLGIHWCKET